jgi:hypothetical protein
LNLLCRLTPLPGSGAEDLFRLAVSGGISSTFGFFSMQPTFAGRCLSHAETSFRLRQRFGEVQNALGMLPTSKRRSPEMGSQYLALKITSVVPFPSSTSARRM